MCEECDKLDAELAGARLDSEADGETDIYRGIVLSRAYEIVQHELWINGGEMGKLLHCAGSMAHRMKDGRPTRKRFFMLNMDQLEKARATGRRRINVVATFQLQAAGVSL